MGEAGQKRVQAQAAAIADATTERRSTSYELCTDQERIRMIGGDYQAAGTAFLEAHPEQVRWLEAHGVTLEDAAAQSEQWLAEQITELRGV